MNIQSEDPRPVSITPSLGTKIMPRLRVEGIYKSFSDRPILDAIDITIAGPGIYSLIGPSGCGKTTLLRIIDGLETPDQGRLWIDGVDMTEVPSERRPVNLVFQRYALFPHLNVYKNIAFGLEVDGTPRSEIQPRVESALDRVRLQGFGPRRIDSLSGGQQQRVALARALVKKPRLVLLDEPFSALDPHLRDEMRSEVLRLSQELAIPFILVTHDQDEALSLSREVGVLLGGKLCQWGTPQEIYRRPTTLEVARFVGALSAFELPLQNQNGLPPGFRITSVSQPGSRDGYPKNLRSNLAYVRPELITIRDPSTGRTWGNTLNLDNPSSSTQSTPARERSAGPPAEPQADLLPLLSMTATVERRVFQGALIQVHARSRTQTPVEVHLLAAAHTESDQELSVGREVELLARPSDLMQW